MNRNKIIRSSFLFGLELISKVSSLIDNTKNVVGSQSNLNLTSNVEIDKKVIVDTSQEIKKLFNFHFEMHFERFLSKYDVL